jgi:hypothetical protein
LPSAYELGPDGRRWHSWRVRLLPFLEGDAIYKRYRFDEPWDGPNNSKLAEEMPKMFAFPSSHRKGNTITNYLAIVGPNAIWPGAQPCLREPKDGRSTTIQIAENEGLGVNWLEPRDLEFDSMSFELQNPEGISSRYKMPAVAMADSTIRSLDPTLDPVVVRALATADGGEKVEEAGVGWKLIEDGRQRELRD